MQPFDHIEGDTILDENSKANDVSGINLSVRTNLGRRVEAWRPGPAVTGDNRFFCHGYSLGTFGLYGYSVWGHFIPHVLADEYSDLGRIDRAEGVAAGDIIVWWRGGTDTYHSALIEEPRFIPDRGILDQETTIISSKTGTRPLWKGVLIHDIRRQYREAASLEIYRPLW